MYTLMNSPYLALTMAHGTIDERVHRAESRAAARSARAHQRAARREAARLSASPTEHYRLPWWAFRYLHPVR
jgi:hypothetical protein